MGSGTVLSIFVVVISGLYLGFMIGTTSIVQVFQSNIANCSMYTGPASCYAIATTAHGTGCVWNATMARCLFTDGIICDGVNATVNKTLDRSLFDEKCVEIQGMWHHKAGWTPAQLGLFGAISSASSLIACPLAERILATRGRHVANSLMGILGVVGSLLVCGSFIADSFAFALVGRVVVGTSTFFVVICCPTFVGEYAPWKKRKTIVSFFQIAITFGIFFIALIGFILHHTIDWATVDDMVWRLEIAVGLNLLGALGCLAFGVVGWMADIKPDVEVDASIPVLDETQRLNASASDAKPTETTTPHASAPLWKQVCVAVFLPFSQQFSGINAMITYAPLVAVAAGFTPAEATVLVMLWNFILALVAGPLNRKSGFRLAYLSGIFSAGIGNIIMAVALTVLSGTTRKYAAAAASFAIITAFELGIGLTYWPLASRAFYPPYVDRGTALVFLCESVFSFASNFGYPVVAAASAEYGQTLCFGLFAVVSFISLLVLRPTLPRNTEYG